MQEMNISQKKDLSSANTLKYDVNDEAKITVDEASFVSVLFINGSGTIETDDYEKTIEFKAGDSFFVSAGLRSIIIKGQATMVVTRI